MGLLSLPQENLKRWACKRALVLLFFTKPSLLMFDFIFWLYLMCVHEGIPHNVTAHPKVDPVTGELMCFG
jgi:hypothetical protein